MTWNLFGTYLDVILSSALVVSLFRLKLQFSYLAILVFILFDSLQSIAFLAARALHDHGTISMDYRAFWCFMEWLQWITTFWMVYAVLTAILKHLPGILRFSLRLLSATFIVSIAVALFTVRSEYAASAVPLNSPFLYRLTAATAVIDRALSMAELLAILAILTFFLRFPVQVPRNLAVLSAGLSVYLFFRIAFFLLRTYVPSLQQHFPKFQTFPVYLIGGCLIYWFFSINAAGEKTFATLGRAWQSVPRQHLVRQLEALNAALLQSHEPL